MDSKIRDKAAIIFETKFNLPETTFIALFDSGFIDVTRVRNELIRTEACCIAKHSTKEDAIVILSERYDCSDSTVRQVIYNQSKK